MQYVIFCQRQLLRNKNLNESHEKKIVYNHNFPFPLTNGIDCLHSSLTKHPTDKNKKIYTTNLRTSAGLKDYGMLSVVVSSEAEIYDIHRSIDFFIYQSVKYSRVFQTSLYSFKTLEPSIFLTLLESCFVSLRDSLKYTDYLSIIKNLIVPSFVKHLQENIEAVSEQLNNKILEVKEIDEIFKNKKASDQKIWADKRGTIGRFVHQANKTLINIDISELEYFLKTGNIEDASDVLYLAINAADRLRRAYKNFKNFSAPIFPQIKKVFVDKELSFLLKSFQKIFSIRYANINFAIRIDRHRHRHIYTDFNILAEIIETLLSNCEEELNSYDSLKNKSIVVTVREIKNKIVLEIEDNGRGFSDDLMDRYLENGFTTKSEGSGLGLFIVNNFAKQINAKLKIEKSKELKGAKVSLTFLTNLNSLKANIKTKEMYSELSNSL